MVFDTAIIRCQLCHMEHSQLELEHVIKHGFDAEGEPSRVEFYRCATNAKCIKEGHELVKKILPGGVTK